MEDDEAFFVIASMPGVSKDDVRIKIEDGNLVLMGRIDRSKFEGKKILLKEINTGNFYPQIQSCRFNRHSKC